MQNPNENIRILVVDDERMNCLVQQLFLQRLGYVVEMAYDGEEAIEIMQEKSFDCVLSDINMPKMNGFELSVAIRKLKSPKNQVPIIGITSSTSADIHEQALKFGMQEVLVKPVLPEQIDAVIKKWVVSQEAAVV